MKQSLTFFQSRARMAWQYAQTYQIKLPLSSIFLLNFMIFLFAGGSVMNAQDPCDINNGW